MFANDNLELIIWLGWNVADYTSNMSKVAREKKSCFIWVSHEFISISIVLWAPKQHTN